MGNILFLQGPLGPFFSRLAARMSSLGFSTYKINFNGGDKYYSQADFLFDYRGGLNTWRRYLSRFVVRNEIDVIVVYGDCREYHQVARAVAKQKNCRLWVFEEGYIRPNYITFEEGGVNAYSSLNIESKEHAQALSKTWGISNTRSNIEFGETFFHRLCYGIAYYFARTVSKKWLKNDGHHRPYSGLDEARYWLAAIRRKMIYRFTESNLDQQVISRWAKKFYFVPLQVHCDSQIHTHSQYHNVGEFIRDVVASFASHAPKGTALVLKHHPMDRGFRNYSVLVKRLAMRYGLGDRLIYGHELHIPTMLRNAIGTVTVNSTVGLSALYHGCPTKVMGNANYNLPGLTSSNSLDEFWCEPQPVDREYLKFYREAIRRHTQLNGNFYRDVDIACEQVLDALKARGMLIEQQDHEDGDLIFTIA